MTNQTRRNFLSTFLASGAASLLSSCDSRSASDSEIQNSQEQVVLIGKLLNNPDGQNNGYQDTLSVCFVDATLPNGRKCILEFGRTGPDTYPAEGTFAKVKYSNKEGSRASWEVAAYAEVSEAEYKAAATSKSNSEWVR